jgi:hypothetical protein
LEGIKPAVGRPPGGRRRGMGADWQRRDSAVPVWRRTETGWRRSSGGWPGSPTKSGGRPQTRRLPTRIKPHRMSIRASRNWIASSRSATSWPRTATSRPRSATRPPPTESSSGIPMRPRERSTRRGAPVGRQAGWSATRRLKSGHSRRRSAPAKRRDVTRTPASVTCPLMTGTGPLSDAIGRRLSSSERSGPEAVRWGLRCGSPRRPAPGRQRTGREPRRTVGRRGSTASGRPGSGPRSSLNSDGPTSTSSLGRCEGEPARRRYTVRWSVSAGRVASWCWRSSMSTRCARSTTFMATVRAMSSCGMWSWRSARSSVPTSRSSGTGAMSSSVPSPASI